MVRRALVATSVSAALLLTGGYATADVLDVVPGVLTRQAPAPDPDPAVPADGSPMLPRAAASEDALAPAGEDTPIPTEQGLGAAIAEASTAKELKGRLGVSVHDAATGTPLYRQAASRPRVPASTAKLLAAVAVADTLDLGARLPTRVVAAAGSTDLALVAGGDMLLDAGGGDPDAVAGRAGLEDLARQVAGELRRTQRTTVQLRLDLSYAPGPRVPSTWNPNDVRDGFAGPVVMIGLESSSALPTRPAPASPEKVAAEAFVERLAEHGVTATLQPPTTWRAAAAPEAAELGLVESATIGQLLALALERSDNALAESLVRQAAATAGRPTEGPGDTAAFIRARLEADGIPTEGMVLRDASGLSPDQAVAPETLARALVRGTGSVSPPLRGVLAALPVAGLRGTLAERFALEDTTDVLGVPRAKTGTLRAGSSLAGTTVTADGRPLVVVVMADGFPRTYDGTLRARAALDRIVAAITRCGCR